MISSDMFTLQSSLVIYSSSYQMAGMKQLVKNTYFQYLNNYMDHVNRNMQQDD
jgi:hypothetical protein